MVINCFQLIVLTQNIVKIIIYFNLKETTINLFKEDKSKYIITSDKSKISNNNKLIELNGNVLN